MTVTEFSFLSSVVWSTVILLVGVIFVKSNKFVLRFGISGFLIIMSVGVLRLFLPFETPSVNIIGDSVVMPALQRGLRFELFSVFGKSIQLSHLLIFIWAAGSLVCLTALVFSIVRQKKAIGSLNSVYSPQLGRIMDSIVKKSKPNQTYKFIVSDEIGMPVMTGLFVPTILMPPLQLSDREAECVLRHEWCHFLHGDLWKKLLFNILCAFMWWNPFVYVIRKRLSYILEVNCDCNVLSGQDDEDRIAYVQSTLSVIRQLANAPNTMPNAVAFADSAGGSNTVRRCELALFPPPQIRQGIKVLFSIILVSVLILSYAFVVQPTTMDPPVEAGSSYLNMSPENSYLVDNGDGTYDLYCEGDIFDSVISSELDSFPYCELPIKK